jgi:CRP-like cAMP-binding protein
MNKQSVNGIEKKYLEGIFQYFNRFLILTRDEFEDLIPYFEIRKFEKKKKVIDIGEVDTYFNIIVKGLVRKYTMVGKKDVTLQLSIEGQMIHSEISFNTQTPSEDIIETIEPTIMISMSYDNLQKVYDTFPKIEKLGRLIISYMFIKKDYRDFSILKSTTRERFLKYMETHPDMLQRVPQKYIASYLNIKPETFSRLKHLIKYSRVKV